MRSGQIVYNSTRKKDQRIGRLLRMHANRQEALEVAHCGDIVAVIGLSDTRTGDTICSQEKPILLESIEFPAPVISISIKPATRADIEKLGSALHHLADEDPTFVVGYDEETAESIISGMGELHLEVLVERMKREFGVIAEVGRPEVAYRETGTTSQEGQYKHVKQTGGRGQYAHMVFRIEPTEPGSGFQFEDEVTGGKISREYLSAIERGIVEEMGHGPYAGFPIVDVLVTVYDGSMHDVDSSEQAFRTCGRMGFREACLRAGIELLEPIMSVEVTVPDEHTGAVTGNLCSKRGRITGMESRANATILQAMVPLAEMFGYASEIRNLTSGRGTFTMQFEHYESVPYAIAERVVEERKEARAARG
jgi:elongation factor G